MRIPVNEPLLDGNERRYLNECIETGWISSEGPFVGRFERELSGFLGVNYGVAVANGTAALETALYALNVQKGNEVILPTFTIISCVLACLRVGATPVLVDIDPETWTMDVSQVASRITSKTRVIMPVHIFGHPVEMDPLFDLKMRHGVSILEDAAEVIGAEYCSSSSGGKWLKCGAMGDAAATSFYANKIITAGEGGMVLTSDERIAQRACDFRNLCFGHEDRFCHENAGANFRMTNLQAAVGVAQLERLEQFLAIKKKIGECYQKKLSTIQGIRFMKIQPWARSIYWMYCVELEPGLSVDAKVVMQRLKADGIGSRPFFRGMHEQPVFAKMGLFKGESYPKSEYASRFGFYLPSGLTMTEEKVDVVVRALGKAIHR